MMMQGLVSVEDYQILNAKIAASLEASTTNDTKFIEEDTKSMRSNSKNKKLSQEESSSKNVKKGKELSKFNIATVDNKREIP